MGHTSFESVTNSIWVSQMNAVRFSSSQLNALIFLGLLCFVFWEQHYIWVVYMCLYICLHCKMLWLSPLEHRIIVSVALFNNDWFQAIKRMQKGHKSIMKVNNSYNRIKSVSLKYFFIMPETHKSRHKLKSKSFSPLNDYFLNWRTYRMRFWDPLLDNGGYLSLRLRTTALKNGKK